MPRRQPDASSELQLRINEENLPKGCFKRATAVVKKGPQAYKTVTIRLFGNPDTGEIKKRELYVQQWTAKKNGPGFNFEEKGNRWFCENEEIDAFSAFLNGEVSEPGKYRKVDPSSALSSVIEHIEHGEADASQIQQLISALSANPEAANAFAKHAPSQLLIDGIQAARQRETIECLSSAAASSDTREEELRRILDDNWWIFGGKFIGVEKRRQLTVLDQVDIPLIRPDGALHIIELKRANVPKLVIKHRNHYIVGPAVNEAVGQAVNHLRELDEQRPYMLSSFGIECRRAFATVVIGHPRHVQEVSENEISHAIRTYNSNLSRVEVITYADLVAGAASAFNLSTD